MTTRPGIATVDVLRKTRSKHLCHVIKITRRDGFVLRVTDHDRTITFDNEKYRPIIVGELSAERREAALRSGDQEARGIVDGAIVTIPDLLGNLYRGAEVKDVILDWSNPRHIPVRHRKWIRAVNWTGSQWVGVMEARTQVLQRPAGGRFGGVFTQGCLYKLGDPLTCKRDISIGVVGPQGLAFSGAGVKVQTIVDTLMKVEFYTATLAGSIPDDFFREGEFEWKWALAVVTGTNTATTTSTTLTDGTKTWTVNEHAGRDVRILSAAGGFVSGTKWARIVSNTSTVLTFATQANMSGLGAGTNYDICGPSVNIGLISPIAYYTHATRYVEFLLPTTFPIVVGDSGIIRAGCDGLTGTCKEKFDNLLNHGGDPFAPSANAIIEPIEGA
jgi:uncharacterized phage protein (TIGR02218 family)